MDLQTLFYIVIGISAIAYAVLDGFDLGVGSLHLFAKNDRQRRIFLNAIGPFWDGNEVWLVIVMGALFAGFPNAYATVFSGFYTLLMFLIAGLMFRAAAIEFRSKQESKRWRKVWDVVFCVASLLVAFTLGVLVGNIVQGIALNETQDYIGTFSDFFNPYTLLTGVTAIALFSMHGAIYLLLKTEGDTHDVVHRWVNPSIVFFIACYSATTVATLLYEPHMAHRFFEMPALSLIPFLALLSILNIPFQVKKKRDGWAFISSICAIALLLSLFGIGTYPNIIRSTLSPETNTVTIYNAASSHKTLVVLLIVVAIGIPLVLAYGFLIYRVFRGKVRLENNSY